MLDKGNIECPQTLLLCYWAARELGMSMTEIANRLGLTQPAVCNCGKAGRRNRKAERLFSLYK